MHNSHIPYMTIDGTMQVYETIMAILDDARKGKANDLVDFANVDTIILDSIWKTSDLLLEEIKEEAQNTGKANYDNWGELLTRMSKIVDGFAASDFNFIATCGEATRQDEMDAEEKVITFNFSGSYRNRLPYSFDFNLYMKEVKRGKEVVYVANTKEENKRTAKSRVSMPRQIPDPSFDKIQEFVNKGLAHKEL